MLTGRKPLDLSSLKCIVIDEADVFFLDDKNFASLSKIAKNPHIKDNPAMQWILFSATYPQEDYQKYEQVQKRQVTIVEKAQ